MKYHLKPHVKFWRRDRHACLALLLLLVLVLVGWGIYRCVLSWAQGREYSKFDGPDLTDSELSKIKQFAFHKVDRSSAIASAVEEN